MLFISKVVGHNWEFVISEMKSKIRLLIQKNQSSKN